MFIVITKPKGKCSCVLVAYNTIIFSVEANKLYCTNLLNTGVALLWIVDTAESSHIARFKYTLNKVYNLKLVIR